MDTAEEQRKVYDQYYNGGGFRMLASTYYDLIINPQANKTAADYIRDRIRERVSDPEVAELLCPNDHPYGTKRATFETNYYEAFNLPHVHLVDARTTPIVRITDKGIATTAQEYEFDVVVLATGFDVGAGALARMGVIGRGGRRSPTIGRTGSAPTSARPPTGSQTSSISTAPERSGPVQQPDRDRRRRRLRREPHRAYGRTRPHDDGGDGRG